MANVGLILLVFAFICAAIAARLQQIGAVHLGWLALPLFLPSQLAGATHL